MSVELWYVVQVLVRESEPVNAGPTQLLVHGTENPEMALSSLQARIKADWQQAVATGNLWDVIDSPESFLVLNPAAVIGIQVTMVKRPESEITGDIPIQHDAPRQPATGGIEIGEEVMPEAA